MCNVYIFLFTMIFLVSLFLSFSDRVEEEPDKHRRGLSFVLTSNQPDTQLEELKEQYELLEVEYKALKSEYRLWFILLLIACGLLYVINLILYARREQAHFLQAEIAEEKNHIKLEKQQIESELKLSGAQTDNLQELLFRYDLFLRFRVEQQLQMQKNANRVRSKYPALGDAYDKMMEMEREQFNRLVDKLFTVEDIQRLFGIQDKDNILTKNDRLLLFMLANNADNEQIAALLNITTENLKSRKSYLKRKIMEKSTDSNGFQRLIALF